MTSFLTFCRPRGKKLPTRHGLIWALFFLFGACCFVIKLDIKRVGDGPSQLYMHIILYISQLPAYVFYL